jgi:hypothetical protein
MEKITNLKSNVILAKIRAEAAPMNPKKNELELGVVWVSVRKSITRDCLEYEDFRN